MAESKKRKQETSDIADAASKWAAEFENIGEDDQYTYLEELAPRLNKMHLQYLQGIIGFDDDEDEDDFPEEDDEEDEEDEEDDVGDDNGEDED